MSNDNTEKNSDEFHASMLEALRQNWDNARYFESRRWNYIYYYYFAFGVAIVYFANSFKECGFNFLQGDPNKFIFISLAFLFLTFIGLGAFFHLSHANIEYKNFIRTTEFIAEDLKLNQGFSEFRTIKENNKKAYMTLPLKLRLWEKVSSFFRTAFGRKIRNTEEDNRKTYMALPLQLGIRKPVPAIKLTAFGAAFSAGITIFYYFWFIRLTIPIGLAYGYILCLAAIISIVIYLLLCCYFEKKEDEAEDKLTLRDPNPHTKGCVVKKEDNQ